MKCVSVDQMRAIESEANTRGIGNDRMMRTAGEGIARVINARFLIIPQKTATGLIGSGNNGGDTLIALSELQRAGWKTNAYLVRPRPQDDPLLLELAEAGGRVFDSLSDNGLKILDDLIATSGILLDGILGTGFKPPIRQEIAGTLSHIQAAVQLPPVVAVDCPSGVDCENGLTAPETLTAQLTICMEAVKKGLTLLPAFTLCGEIQTVSLNLPTDLETLQTIDTHLVDLQMVKAQLPPRAMDAHKGSFGTLLAATGSIQYPGAALLSGRAACLTGVGLVQIATPEPVQGMLAGHLPEVVWTPLPHENGAIGPYSAEVLLKSFGRATCLLLGPGLGQQPGTLVFMRSLLENQSFKQLNIPMVVDADGLRLLSRIPGWPGLLPKGSVLTPHPGEMAALTGMSISDIQQNRFKYANQFAQNWQHVIILKGAVSLVASPDGQVNIIPVATPALAHAGTGDVLAGTVAGLRAQKLSAFDAAWAGAFIHGLAGIKAALSIGNTASVLAGDVCNSIPQVINTIRA